jgi:hypothetical protein
MSTVPFAMMAIPLTMVVIAKEIDLLIHDGENGDFFLTYRAINNVALLWSCLLTGVFIAGSTVTSSDLAFLLGTTLGTQFLAERSWY